MNKTDIQRMQDMAFRFYQQTYPISKNFWIEGKALFKKARYASYGMIVFIALGVILSLMNPQTFLSFVFFISTLLISPATIYHVKLKDIVLFEEYDKIKGLTRFFMRKALKSYQEDMLIAFKSLNDKGVTEDITHYLEYIFIHGQTQDSHRAFQIKRAFEKGIQKNNFPLLFETMQELWMFTPHLKNSSHALFDKTFKLTVLDTVIHNGREISIGAALK